MVVKWTATWCWVDTPPMRQWVARWLAAPKPAQPTRLGMQPVVVQVPRKYPSRREARGSPRVESDVGFRAHEALTDFGETRIEFINLHIGIALGKQATITRFVHREKLQVYDHVRLPGA